ncbi:hypothetical protein [Tropicimonas isoalkanivorans]|uniref:Lipoprotein n=1 Tax=Tropicimonas isoalkanivorans TaxID=441112 RepID=A0A1I1KTR2_9RHOB|nr:hypothetical protein [Tropicimonas isoalkanivorans]SFC62098.1 hypothetical protein SAMN04488094_10711 [Tropicimonas isoalkanivorans]
MGTTRGLPAVLAAVVALALSGCGDDDASGDAPTTIDPDAVRAAVTRSAGIDPSSYAGEVAFKFTEDLPSKTGPIPIVLYAGLSPETDTRLAANAFVDLRLLQLRLPEILSRAIVDECGQEILLDFAGVEADGGNLRAGGIVEARFYRCRNKGTPEEQRGHRIFTQRLEAIAVATAGIQNDCIAFDLKDIYLDPYGLIGGLATFFGFTESARNAILTRGGAFLAENPVCPTLPPDLASLDPSFSQGGPRDLGDGGIGVALSGSVDTSAATLVGLVGVLKDRGLVEGQR